MLFLLVNEESLNFNIFNLISLFNTLVLNMVLRTKILKSNNYWTKVENKRVACLPTSPNIALPKSIISVKKPLIVSIKMTSYNTNDQ